MSAGSAPEQVIAMCQALELSKKDTLTVLGLVGELDAGYQDAQLSDPEEYAMPRYGTAKPGELPETLEPLEPEEFMGKAAPAGDQTAELDPGVVEIAEAAYLNLVERGAFDGLFDLLRPRGLSHLGFLDSIGWTPSDLLPAPEVDLIGYELAGRPMFSCPDYWRQLFDIYAPPRMAEVFRRILITESVEAA